MPRQPQPVTIAGLAPAAPRRTQIDRAPVVVISHERSGTHFLLNTLGRAFGYDHVGFANFDGIGPGINYFHPPSVLQALRSVLRGRLVKSHHPVEFFDGILDELLRHVVILYIHRDPVDVMISTWRYVHTWDWPEGPLVTDPLAFALAEPEGYMMRYQMRQKRNMLVRWADHVAGWVDAASGRNRIGVVGYSQLRDRYADTVRSLVPLLGDISGPLTAPDRVTNVIAAKPRVALPKPDPAVLRNAALSEVGDTMRRLGYA